MRCIEIHKPTWPLQGRKSSNLNMRCIEISLPRWRVSLLLHSRTLTWDVLKYFGIELKRKFGKMSNLNMRCIEMRLYWAINSLSLLSNLNMRCIEIDACGMGGHCSVGRTLTWDVLKSSLTIGPKSRTLSRTLTWDVLKFPFEGDIICARTSRTLTWDVLKSEQRLRALLSVKSRTLTWDVLKYAVMNHGHNAAAVEP